MGKDFLLRLQAMLPAAMVVMQEAGTDTAVVVKRVAVVVPKRMRSRMLFLP